MAMGGLAMGGLAMGGLAMGWSVVGRGSLGMKASPKFCGLIGLSIAAAAVLSLVSSDGAAGGL
ncbi:MAG: hypothetical protein ACI9ZM_001784 [Paracoccaceae bacterium]